MCILFCYLHDQTFQFGYDLILLSNRDEDFHRPALAAHVWNDTRFVLGGQDQTTSREGGTWLSINTVHSKIAVLLNLPSRVLEQKRPEAKSRGFLVRDFVNDERAHLDSYIDHLQKIKTDYTGFNFLALEKHASKWRAKYLNNRSSTSSPMEIETPLFGFSNHVYGDESAFKKTRLGCQLFERILCDFTKNYTEPITDENGFIDHLFRLLANAEKFDDDSNLSETYAHYDATGRLQISSIQVQPTERWPNYGTRTSTIILIRQDQSGLFIEKTLADPINDPGIWNKQMWKFQLNKISEPPSKLAQ